MHDFRTEQDSYANEYELQKRMTQIHDQNNKILKIDLMKLIKSSVKGMRKKLKKTGTKKIDRKKDRNLDFLLPGKQSCLFSLFHRKKLTHDQKSGKNEVTQVTA